MSRSKAIRMCVISVILAVLVTAAVGGYALLRFSPIGKMYSIVNLLDRTYYQDVDNSKLFESGMRGIVAGLGDPYTVYMTKAEWDEFQIRTQGTYSGVGITIGVKDDKVIIISPMKNSPAEKAGLKAGDIVLKVDGKPITSSDEAASLIRGQSGTQVILTIERDGKDFDVALTRQEITISAVNYSMLEDGIGYLQLTSFNEHAYSETSQALQSLKDMGAKAIILDLRYNGGGLLSECTAIANLFLPKGPIVSYKGKAQPEKVEESQGPGLGMPLIVLVNEGTASASEILAGAIQDRKAGTLVGVTTFGKGLIQTTYPLKDGSVVKVTIAEYYTPSGRAINGKGITPDVVVQGDDAQMAKAMELAREKVSGS